MALRPHSATGENDRRLPENGPVGAPRFPPIELSERTRSKQKCEADVELGDPGPSDPNRRILRRILPIRRKVSKGTSTISKGISQGSAPEANKLVGMNHPGLSSQPPSIHSCLISPTPISSQPPGIKRKRVQELETKAEANEQEDVRASKHVRELPPSNHISEYTLRWVYHTMDASAKPQAVKWPSSTGSVRSDRSLMTSNSHYRSKHLKDANIFVHVDPPRDIHAFIDNIVNKRPSYERYDMLRVEAKKFWRKCKVMVYATDGEDDFTHIFSSVFEKIGAGSLILHENATWKTALKPTTRQENENSGLLSVFNAMNIDVDDDEEVGRPSIPPPPKHDQQSASHAHISTQNARANTSDTEPLPGRTPPHPDTETLSASTTHQPGRAYDMSPIQTPCPDITIGIEKSALVFALAEAVARYTFSYTTTNAKQLLEILQAAKMPSERNGRPEQALIMVPTLDAEELTFPTLLFESKGYSAGEQVFEAQNQAAVSGACGIKMQMMLDELVRRTTTGPYAPPTPLKSTPPLVFSVCTEGPYHELWAHYTTVENGEHKFNMALLNTCNGVVLKQVEKFFFQVYNVMIWTTGPFLDTLAERLALVAKRANA
ncbi:hypothetical protein K505DRAFT_340909 [Melanomma pulvis-pyrius CBS 109.77]|uniref:Uncharacterized protein n=1 Tax=Melanomma pulvis-pyrius CBS 109.77 TaxID=1314802 RepID=A0A6A6X143_9PLEO|nr:hypothetical protein K505DRAFT_340909 [Melanomma pulvis-pyrius CBS 109.77]